MSWPGTEGLALSGLGESPRGEATIKKAVREHGAKCVL
jgi:hypothetical protein